MQKPQMLEIKNGTSSAKEVENTRTVLDLIESQGPDFGKPPV